VEIIMRLKTGLIGLAAVMLLGGVANAGTLRVVVVEASDVGAYVKALEDGKALLKKKGSPSEVHVWLARYAGPNAGSVVVSIEYPSLEALAKDDTMMRSDAELSAWLERLSKIRKIVSDSIYEELKP
jgi:hypothetical protein